jgi:ribosomal protein S12 methylthiotransferase accessory factor
MVRKNSEKNTNEREQKLGELAFCLDKAPVLLAYPVLYDKYLFSQEEHPEKVKKALNCGLIKEMGKGLKFSDEPKLESYYAKHILEVESENLYGSASDFNKDLSKIKALGECFERFCLIKPNVKKIIRASFDELSALGKNALNPESCFNFEEKHLRCSTKEYKKILRSSRFKWVVGEDMLNRKKAFMPYQLVFLPEMEEIKGEPLIRIPITTGAACGEDYEDVVLRGIFECIERDSSSLSWLKKRNVPRLILDEPFFASIEEYLSNYSLKLFAWETTTDLGVPSVLAVIIDKTGIGPAVSAGTKTSFSLRKALLGAILEAIQGRLWIRGLNSLNKYPKLTEKDIIDLPTRGVYWCNSERIKHLNFLLEAKKRKKISSIKEINYKKPLKEILSILKKHKMDCFAIDISHPQMKDTGFCVARVIIPQLHPMHLDDDLPYHDGERIKSFPGEINKIPAPFL